MYSSSSPTSTSRDVDSEQLEFYRRTIEPLVVDVTNGESVLALLCGAPNVDSARYLSSTPGNTALLVQAAEQLVAASHTAVHASAKNQVQSAFISSGSHAARTPAPTPAAQVATVTLTWVKIDCRNDKEPIFDILRNASSGSNGPTPGLSLRDLGKGRGFSVPGLTEVAFSSAADLEAIINHVLSAQSSLAPDYTSHTVIQLAFTPMSKAGSQQASHTKSLSLLEPAGTGRLTFMIMSAFSDPGAKSGRRANFPWVDSIPEVLETLNSGLLQPKFSQRKTLMYLRDALCGRQKTSMTIYLQPELSTLDNTLMWLELSQHLCVQRVNKPTKIAKPVSARESSSAAPASALSDGLTKEAFQKVTNSANKQSSAQSTQPKKVSSAQKDLSTSKGVPAFASAASSSTQKKSAPVTAPMINHTTPALAASSSAISVFSTPATSAKSRNYLSDALESPSPLPPPPTASGRSGGASDRYISEASQNAASKAAVALEAIGGLSGLVGSNDAEASVDASGASLKKLWAAEGRFSDPSPTEKEALERVKGLTAALIASQQETQAVRGDLDELTVRYNACKEAFEKLMDELKAEGTTLQQRDRERLRKSLRDVKDYEVYKNVIEAAMLRMQSELSTVLEDNKSLRLSLDQSKTAYTKLKSQDTKTDRDFLNLKKRVEELESEIAVLGDEKQKSLKDRDVAIATVVKLKGDAARKNADLIQDSKRKDEQILQLKRKLAEATERTRQLNDEKRSIEAAFAREVQDLQSGNSKAVEILVNLHEENEHLRSAFSELVLDPSLTSNSTSTSAKGDSVDSKSKAIAGKVKDTKSSLPANESSQIGDNILDTSESAEAEFVPWPIAASSDGDER